jgi:GGDEF domain-containing protein
MTHASSPKSLMSSRHIPQGDTTGASACGSCATATTSSTPRAPAASIGTGTFDGRTGADGILADATLAMYEAKRAGGGRSAHWAAAQSASSTR